MRHLRLGALVTLVCWGVGVLVGSVVLSLLTVLTDSGRGSVSDYLVASLFFGPFFAGPFGLIAGLLGTYSMIHLGEGRLRGAGRSSWTRHGALAGAAFGSIAPVFIPFLSTANWALYATGVIAGSSAGAVAAQLGWRKFGSATLQAASPQSEQEAQ